MGLCRGGVGPRGSGVKMLTMRHNVLGLSPARYFMFNIGHFDISTAPTGSFSMATTAEAHGSHCVLKPSANQAEIKHD